MNENRIQDVIQIEKQADEIYNKAVHEAERIPQQAEQEAKVIIEKAKVEAEKEAQAILANAQAKEECEKILVDANESIQHNQTLAKRNFDRAVTYVISRVLGRE